MGVDERHPRLAAAALAVGVAAAGGPALAALPHSPLSCEPAAEVSSGAFGTRLLAAASEDGTRNALVSPSLEAVPRGAAGAPLVVHADAWEPPMASTEADILARRILLQPGSSFRLDPQKAHALADEIERVLSRIRDAHPVVKGVTVRERFDPWSLILGLEPDLYGKVSRAASLLSVEGGPVPLHTGHEPFDTLNTESGLAAMELLSFLSSAVLYFNKPVNPFISPLQYSSVEGVEYAEPDFQLGDGPDVEVSRSQGIWYAVFRRAWGDCPSGCIESELFFFIVEGDEVERIESVQAMDMPMFAELVGRLEGAP